MTISQIKSRLKAIGASETEAGDLAPHMHLNGWFEIPAHKPSAKVQADCGIWLMDFRAERKQIARAVRATRERTRDAGYMAASNDVPVYVGCGMTKW